MDKAMEKQDKIEERLYKAEHILNTLVTLSSSSDFDSLNPESLSVSLATARDFVSEARQLAQQ